MSDEEYEDFIHAHIDLLDKERWDECKSIHNVFRESGMVEEAESLHSIYVTHRYWEDTDFAVEVNRELIA